MWLWRRVVVERLEKKGLVRNQLLQQLYRRLSKSRRKREQNQGMETERERERERENGNR
jgi:hypothetical protein